MGYAKVEEKVEMHVPFYEVQSLMLDREKHLHIRQKEMEKMLNDPETNNETMTKKEFYGTFKEWLDVTRQLMDDPYSLDRSGTKYNKVDTDKSGSITEIELKNFIMEVNYKEVVMEDDIAEIMMRHLDIDGNKDIDKEEFKLGIAKWVKEINHILVVVIVCIIMGILTSFRSKFPNWTLLIAFPLYLLSLVVIYFVDDTFQFT
ncbi:Calcium-binding EF-hand [Cynara cardunculus var. scolymus]|uniref:Calcium-binding EF-hand n=1 Tax=Cynara cardunculus var. scolymus TaxID=59895 RepID=A0A103Y498_CYNCS|nr:Calcium-binding EF-hand [Cynara cardunculus var. scolymus]